MSLDVISCAFAENAEIELWCEDADSGYCMAMIRCAALRKSSAKRLQQSETPRSVGVLPKPEADFSLLHFSLAPEVFPPLIQPTLRWALLLMFCVCVVA